MENNKEIGKLFKQKLDSLDNLPSDFVWNKIEKELEKKRKPKFAFWFLPLLCTIGLGTFLYFINNPKVLINKKTNSIETKGIINLENKLNYENSDPNLENFKTNIQEKLNSDSLKLNEISKTLSQEKQDANQLKLNENFVKTKSKIVLVQKQPQDSIRTKSSKTTSEISKSYKKTRKLIKSTEEYDVYEVTKKYNYIVKKKKIDVIESKLKSTKSKNSLFKKNKNYKNKYFKRKKRNKLSSNKNKIDKNLEIEFKNEEIKHIPSLNISEPELEVVFKKDTTKKVEVKKPEKKILKLFKPKDSTKTEENLEEVTAEKYYISPFFGPTYYGVFNRGNVVINNFYDKPKKGLVTFNYGFYIRTMLTDKYGFRVGFGKTNLEYETEIIKTNESIFDYTNLGLSIVISDSKFNNDSKIILTQKLSYIEMPIEFYYVWKDDEFGFATATGISTMFYQNNIVTLKSNNVSEFEVGNPRNKKAFSATANFVLCFTYKINENLNLEASPQIKYQFYGFEENFKPFIFSLQTGFSYKLF